MDLPRQRIMICLLTWCAMGSTSVGAYSSLASDCSAVASTRRLGSAAAWDYLLPTQCWSYLYPECGGASQSPIDIVTASAQAPDGLVSLTLAHGNLSQAVLKNTGHGLQVDRIDGNVIFDSEQYDALQFHFHFPSEHAVDGALAAAELHVVHQKPGSAGLANLLVTGVMYNVGAPSAFLQTVGWSTTLPSGDATYAIQSASFLDDELNAAKVGGWYAYAGSLTTPPCSETVQWIVFATMLTVSRSQVDQFKALFLDPANNRPLQHLNSRIVEKDGKGRLQAQECWEGDVSGHRRLGSSASWDYLTPRCWSVVYPACAGDRQSPVNIDTSAVGTGSSTLISDNIADPAAPALANTGHGLQVNFDTSDSSFVTFEDEKYTTLQFHFHFPSEHAVDGALSPAELHVVHRKEGSTGLVDLLVVGIMYDLGVYDNSFLTSLGWANVSSNATFPLPITSAMDLKSEVSLALTNGYYGYPGSLTTPPCSETVQWIVAAGKLTVSQAQIDAFGSLFSDPLNNRPLQPVNERIVQKNGAGVGLKGVCTGSHRRLSSWTYQSPQCWSDSYPACAGSSQSPVNINSTAAIDGSDSITLAYANPTSASLKNTGHGLQVDYTDGTATFQGQVHGTLQFHFHFPSEHAVDGQLYPAELHTVHRKIGSSGLSDLLVIGVLYELGASNAFMTNIGWSANLASALPNANDQVAITSTANINLETELNLALVDGFYGYSGSLTTPPCSETVQWVVAATRRTVSQAQVNAFAAIFPVPMNNRPLQPLNTRKVQKNGPGGTGATPEPCAASKSHRRLAGSPWDYLLPQCWAASYPDCGGEKQSPVDIIVADTIVGSTPIFLAHETLESAELKNTGHGLQVDYNVGYVSFDRVKYNTLQFHYHFPSEHAIDGRLYPAEMHTVHQKSGSVGLDDLLVLGVMYELNGTTHSPFLDALGWPSNLPTGSQTYALGSIAVDDELSPALAGGFYGYAGSLTTPPCTESVQWVVAVTPRPISQAQVDAFTALFPAPSNNRPLQLLHARIVQRDGPGATKPSACSGSGQHRRLAGAPWDYSLADCWAVNYPVCAGVSQSPINIATSEAVSPDAADTLVLNHGTMTSAFLKNTGHGLQVDYSIGGVDFNTDTYNTLQFHFHFPSEHAIDGKLFPAELHVVHRKAGSTGLNDLLVTGVMYEVGASASSFLTSLGWSRHIASSLAAAGSSIAVPSESGITLDDELTPLMTGDFYGYKGSLTTPPCSETVQWIVFGTPRTMSITQVHDFKGLFTNPMNNRPLQLLNSRYINRNGAGGYTIEQCYEGVSSSSHRRLGSAAKWSYTLPSCWKFAYPDCAGARQSPINIYSQAATVGADALTTTQAVLAAGTMLTNTGHGLQVNYPSNSGGVSFAGGDYDVLQFHFHFPSEHAVDGALSAGELHAVHRKSGSTGLNDLLVVGVMYDLSSSQSSFLSGMGWLDVNATSLPLSIPGNVDVKAELDAALTDGYFGYPGSLTTPPCTESVQWIVAATKRSVSQAQVDVFAQLFPAPMNNRPLQPLFGRVVMKGGGGAMPALGSAGSEDSDSDANSGSEPGSSDGSLSNLHMLTNCAVHASNGRLRRLASANAAWDYTLPTPCWAYLYPECGGASQSPVNIVTSDAEVSATVVPFTLAHGTLSNAVLKNTGHGLQVDYALGNVMFKSVQYNTLQFHFHFPSEHAMDGVLSAAELHVVHQKPGSTGLTNLLVTGVMYNVGSESAFLNELGWAGDLPVGMATTSIGSLSTLDAELNAAKVGGWYAYSGSLTTPPCSETVQWIVFATARTVSQVQVDKFKAIFPDPSNNRPLQPLNSRVVQKDGTGRAQADECWEGGLGNSRRLGAGASWDYVLPKCWATMYPDCGGTRQSPINIDVAATDAGTDALDTTSLADPSSPALRNTGHGLQVNFQPSDSSSVSFSGDVFNTLQFHFHFPSEHAVDGALSPAELHAVHQKSGSTGYSDLLVIGIMYDLGVADSTFLTSLGWSGISSTASFPLAINGAMGLKAELQAGLASGFYGYPGSLTTPPCSETVQWIVAATKRTVSQSQIDLFSDTFPPPMNNRPLQPVLQRVVQKNGKGIQLTGACSGHGRRLSSWTYQLPQCWSVSYPDCGKSSQSPVNIDTSIAISGSETIALAYTNPSSAALRNTGHGLQVDYSEGTATFQGQTYDTLQFHFHFPSEHAVDGQLHPAEMHTVHRKTGSTGLNDLLVVGVLYELSSTASTFMTKLGWSGSMAASLANTGDEIAISSPGTLNLKAELDMALASGFYGYSGSLTTPPCSETVQWIVAATRRTVSRAQIDQFSSVFPYPMNNRPLQPLNTRKVQRNGPGGTGAVPEPCEAGSHRRLAGGSWDYTLPQCWAAGYPDCDGKKQSPVNIVVAETTSGSTSIALSHQSKSSAKLKNTGHGFQVDYDAGYTTFAGVQYDTLQFHFHFPSEHAIDGKLYAGELHTVHRKTGSTGLSDLLVIGVMYDLSTSTSSAFLSSLGWPTNLPTGNQQFDVGTITLDNELQPAMNGGYYGYAGSLTTPPCTESVQWIVAATARDISQSQVDVVKAVFPDPANNRPLQLLNSRLVQRDGAGAMKPSDCGSARRLASAPWDYLVADCWAVHYPQCAGVSQSPVDIKTSTAIDASDSLVLNHETLHSAALKNTGHGLQVDYPAGSVIFKGAVYDALQFHFHFPSEHSIDGSLFAAELHVVHRKRGSTGLNDLLVTGVMYEVGSSSSAFFSSLGWANDMAMSLATSGSSAPITLSINVDHELNKVMAGGYYGYKGSLTTPPCSETVQWIVFATPRSISREQEREFKNLFPDPSNNRPVQPLNSRFVNRNGEGGYKVQECWEGDSSPSHRRLASGAKWDYTLPICWKYAYPDCAGLRQSPINIDSQSAQLGSVSTAMATAQSVLAGSTAQLFNTGHGLQVNYPDGSGGVTFNSDTYSILQFHFHFPSEHAVDGALSAAELHAVHRKQGSSGLNDLLVVGVMYDLSKTPSSFLLNMGWSGITSASTLPLSIVSAVDVKPELDAALAGGLYSYLGSLTTPPCSETVQWMVAAKKMTVSQAQVDVFAHLFPSPMNNRPLQPLNGRVVTQCCAGSSPGTGSGGNAGSGVPATSEVDCSAIVRRLASGSGATWDYLLPDACWKEMYPDCAGSKQSPIDIVTSHAVAASTSVPFSLNHGTMTGAKLKNSGHGLQVDYNVGGVTFDSVQYNTLQFHFHFPSEHAVDGRLSAAELHVVHQKPNSAGLANLLVTGVMYNVGAESTFLATLGWPSNLPGSGDPPFEVGSIYSLDTELNAAKTGGWYAYSGSLTTPPCSETVQWIVFVTPQTVSQAQVDAFVELFPTPQNNRPLQPVNMRLVEKDGKGRLQAEECWEARDGGHRRLAGGAWNYLTPKCWAVVYPDCSGTRQSPINIDTASAAAGSASLARSHITDPSSPAVKNTGHGLQVDYASSDASSVTFVGSSYKTLQFHFHFPSEHAIDGALSPAELHAVHRKSGSTGLQDLLVIGIMYDLGTVASPFLNTLQWSSLGSTTAFPLAITGAIGMRSELDAGLAGGFYGYLGSLTTPPCTESVQWIVAATKRTVSQAQVDAFNRMFPAPSNNRPLQALHGRVVQKNGGGSLFTGATKPEACTTSGIRRLGSSTAAWDYVRADCWAASYPDCSGVSQSPIEILTSDAVAASSALVLNHGTMTSASLKNTGHGVQVDYSIGRVTFDGDFYNTLQFHFHTPSEHAIDGKLFPAEMHVVHRKSGSTGLNDLLVTGVMYEIGATDNVFLTSLGMTGSSFQSWVAPNQFNVAGGTAPVGGSITLDDELTPLLDGGFYGYQGSLTTPPCSETVQWIVFSYSRIMSQAQVDNFKSLFPEPMNNRPLQALNSRFVNKNGPGGYSVEECWEGSSSTTRRLRGAVAKWSYKLPRCWKYAYPDCDGLRQSPMNINTQTAGIGSESLSTSQAQLVGSAQLINTGHGLQVNYPVGSGGVQFSGSSYTILQFHFHFPSEHAMDGVLSAAELHAVHQKTGSGGYSDLLVVGVLYDKSESPSEFLSDLGWTGMDASTAFPRTIPVAVDVKAELDAALTGSFYGYLGSLTTPPCSETVQWIVAGTRMSVSQAQVDSFASLFPAPMNNRPLQPSFGRSAVKQGAGTPPTKTATDGSSDPDGAGSETGGSGDSGGNVGSGNALEAANCEMHARRLASAGASWDYAFALYCWPVLYADCGGAFQSPVNIVRSAAQAPAAAVSFQMNHGTLADAKLKNTGHGVQVDYAVGSVTFGGVEYNTLQFHFHFPSEHAFDGQLSEGELHVVHQKPGSVGLANLLVTGVMYNVGANNQFLDGLGWAGTLPVGTATVSIGSLSTLDTELSAAKVGGWYAYAGSLTTPPCSETVQWIVFATVRTVSRAQVDKFKAIFPDPSNNRPLQPLNSRVVEKDGMGRTQAEECWEGGVTTHRRLAGASWSYLIPKCWSVVYPDCAGSRQSPINIVTSGADDGSDSLNTDSITDPSSNALANTGHGLQVNYQTTDESYVLFKESRYNTLQFHFHFPSEHAVDGVLSAAELHAVHRAQGSAGLNDLLVIGVMYDLGSSSSGFLTSLGWSSISGTSSVVATTSGTIGLKPELNAALADGFYGYAGSLTTPPCSETVQWIVSATKRTVSQGQVDNFQALFPAPMNNRPLQPVNDRLVQKNGGGYSLDRDCSSGSHRRLSTWSYELPQCWRVAYPDCAGSFQSPVNIDTSAAIAGSDSLTLTYVNPSSAHLKNTGHGLQVDYTGGTAKFQSDNYGTLQFHFHFPSEHAIDGRLYAGELHTVHQKRGAVGLNDLLVIGIMYELGASSSPFMTKLGWSGNMVATLATKGDAIPISAATSLDLDTEINIAGGFYGYSGSLTTPPCSETVQWIVAASVRSVSRAQVDYFNALFPTPSNNRPLQPLNTRKVQKNGPGGSGATPAACSQAHSGEHRRLASSSSWDYVLPQCWVAEYPACGGKKQSPVNIVAGDTIAGSASLVLSHESKQDALLKNTGHGLQVDYDVGSVVFGDLQYNTLQFHFHFPSEHAIDGKLFPAELHVVHQKVGAVGLEDLLVIGVMYEIGGTIGSAFLASLGWPSNLPTGNSTYAIGNVALDAELQPAISDGFYGYSGSLTTPPCTESVQWVVAATPRAMSQAQNDAFKSVFPDPSNNRPLQLLHDRLVHKDGAGSIKPGACGAHRRLGSSSGSSSASWDYLIPDCWAASYPDCAGFSQSPINIWTQKALEATDSLTLSHGTLAAGTLRNTGHGLQVDYPTGSVSFLGDQYNTLQFHFHFPSEHALDGMLFPSELHVVHQKAGSSGLNDLLVTGVMYQIGSANTAVLPSLGWDQSVPAAVATSGGSVPVDASISLDDELQPLLAGGFYGYKGSLTTPPCSETVQWIVLGTASTMSKAQVDGFKAIFPDPANNRPLQLLNSRFVNKNGAGGYTIEECREGMPTAHRRLGAGASWSYTLPQCWKYAYPDCAGLRQSPVNIETQSTSVDSGGMTLAQAPLEDPVTVKNTGHGLQVDYPEGSGGLSFEGSSYNILQFHFHFPSEHAFDGVLSAAELHAVHRKDGSTGLSDLLVVGVMYDVSGTASSFLHGLGWSGWSSSSVGGTVDVKAELTAAMTGGFYGYPGSLTTPPCTESVQWIVSATKMTVSQEQVDAFNAEFPAPMNNRPLQPLNGRVVVKGGAGQAYVPPTAPPTATGTAGECHGDCDYDETADGAWRPTPLFGLMFMFLAPYLV